MTTQKVNAVLRRMELPIGLTKWIKAGTLVDEVAAAYAQLDELNARLDGWEERNPHAAKLTPWFRSREAWKVAGRPKPHWIEVLKWRQTQNRFVPVDQSEIAKDLLMLHGPICNKRRHAANRARAAAIKTVPIGQVDVERRGQSRHHPLEQC